MCLVVPDCLRGLGHLADSSPISGPSVPGHTLSRHTQQRVRLPWRTLVGPVDARGLVTGPDGGGRGARASETWRNLASAALCT